MQAVSHGECVRTPIVVAHGRRVADNDQSSTLWFGVPSSGVGVFHTGTFLRSPQGIVERKDFPTLSQLREVRTAEYAVVAPGRRVADSDENSILCSGAL